MIYLPIKYPTFNEYINAERRNRYAAAKLKKEYGELTFWGLKNYRLPVGGIKTPIKLILKFYVDRLNRDIDSFNFAIKVILDSLQKIGLIENDNLNFITSLEVKVIYDKNEKGVHISWEQTEELKK